MRISWAVSSTRVCKSHKNNMASRSALLFQQTYQDSLLLLMKGSCYRKCPKTIIPSSKYSLLLYRQSPKFPWIIHSHILFKLPHYPPVFNSQTLSKYTTENNYPYTYTILTPHNATVPHWPLSSLPASLSDPFSLPMDNMSRPLVWCPVNCPVSWHKHGVD